MKKVFGLAGMLLAGGTAVAQSSSFPAVADSARLRGGKAQPTSEAEPGSRNEGRVFQVVPYQWDVSVDASIVLPRFTVVNEDYFPGNYGYYGTQVTNLSALNTLNQVGSFARFMIRKSNGTSGATRGAYRLMVGLGVASDNVKNDTIQLYAPISAYYVTTAASYTGLSVGVGYEWQRQLGRFQVIYGYDAFTRYIRTHNEGKRYWQNSNSPANQRSDDFSLTTKGTVVGIAPLVGVKFFVHPRFSLSLESKFLMQYNWTNTVEQGSWYQNGAVIYSSKTRGFSTNLVPISALNATFHFGPVVR